MSISLQLVADFEQRINDGVLPAGSKLQSVRQEAAQRGISPTTVAEVYDILKARGRIQSRPRSGYFVAAPAAPLSMPEDQPSFVPSASLNPEDLLQDMVAAGNDRRIVPFGAAIPAAPYYPVNALKRLNARILQEQPKLLGTYSFPPGAPELRRTLAARYRQFGVKAKEQDVVTTTGAIEAISLALACVARPGDTIGIETPCYPGIFYMIRSQGFRVLEIPVTSERGLDAPALQSAWQASRRQLRAVITIPNFSNPLGTLLPDADKLALVELASELQISLIEDDIYGDMSFSRKRPAPLKAFDQDERVLLCTSFSKSVSPVLRSGCVINARHAEALHAIKYARGSGISALSETLLQRYLTAGGYERHLNRICHQFQQLLAQYSQLVLECFPAGTRLSVPQGGFLLWIELPHAIDGNRLQKDALHDRISIAPGSVFCNRGDRYRNFIRLNCALPCTRSTQRAIHRLGKLIKAQQQ